MFRSEITNHLILGSSNLSASALQRGVEWNLYAPAEVSGTVFEEATDEFMKLFYSESTIALNKETLETYSTAYEQANLTVPLSQKWSESEEQEVMFGPTSNDSTVHEQEEPYYIADSVNETVFEWTKGVCEFRLHWYFEKNAEKI